MIQVKYYIEGGFIKKLSIQGHADFCKTNNLDVVCACASSIIVGGLNAIDDDKNYQMTLNSGDVKVEVITSNEHDDVVLKTIIMQLKTLETKYSKNINVKLYWRKVGRNYEI